MSKLKMASALKRLPSPIVFDTSADPPVPTISPSAPISIMAGQMIFSPANADVPTKLETNNPSTTLYMLPTSIIRRLGMEDTMSLRYP